MPAKRLLIPVKISTGQSGLAEKSGTSAFIETSDPRFSRELRLKREFLERRRRNRPLLKGKQLDPGSKRLLAGWAEQRKFALVGARQEIAVASSHYLKGSNSRIRSIRKLLVNAGVNVEVPMLVRNLTAEEAGKKRLPSGLGRGLELFERGNNVALGDLAGRVDYGKVKSQVLSIVSKMHSLGISHNHLHLGNFVVNPEGNVKLIDLSKAKHYAQPAKTKREFLARFLKDFDRVARGLARLKYPKAMPVTLVGEENKVFSELLDMNPQAKKLRISVFDVSNALAR